MSLPSLTKCSKCEGRAVYHRAYSGERLCAHCFSSSIVEKVKRTVSKYRLLRHGDVIAVAVSGGKDSLSLLKVLNELGKGHSSKLIAISVDEGISCYREEAVGLARIMADGLNISHYILSFDDLYGFGMDEAVKMRKGRVSACAICGILRRRAIDVAARRVKGDVVATAHNLDDLLQTFLINLINGDIKRVRWLDPTVVVKGETIRRVKPLMSIYEEEVAMYAFLNKMPFQSTSCPYMEEGIRSEVRSMLNSLEKKHPGIKYSMLQSMLRISQGLPVDHERKLIQCKGCGFPSSNDLCSVCTTIQMLKREP